VSWRVSAWLIDMLADTPALSTSARAVALIIASRANVDGKAWPSNDDLSKVAGLHPANVRRANRENVAAGLYRVTNGGGRGHANVYEFPEQAFGSLSTSRAVARGFDEHKPARWRAQTRAVARVNPRGGARPIEKNRHEPSAAALDVGEPWRDAGYADAMSWALDQVPGTGQ